MGNLHSFLRLTERHPPESNRQPSQQGQSREANTGNFTTFGNGQNRYNLRRLASRIRRLSDSDIPNVAGNSRADSSAVASNDNDNANVVHSNRRRRRDHNSRHHPTDNQSSGSVTANSSSTATTLRRSARRRHSDSAMPEAPEENADWRRQRPRIDLQETPANDTTSPLAGFIPLPDDPNDSIRYFFLSLPPSADVEGRNNNSNNSGLPHLNDGRLRAVSSFLRAFVNSHFRGSNGGGGGGNAEGGQPPIGEAELEEASSSTIIVRVARLEQPPSEPGAIPSITLQWTVYIMLPNSSTENNQPPSFSSLNEQQRLLVDRAIRFIQTMSSEINWVGEDPNNYERLLRLQEILGFVNRGVGKELIEAQLPAQTFHLTSSLVLPCAICLEEYQESQSIRMLPCGHQYHVQCIDTWLHSRNSCPICRQEPVKQPPPSDCPATSSPEESASRHSASI